MKQMSSSIDFDVIVSGIGVTSAAGQGKNTFISALLQGENQFDVMKRQGRQMSQYSQSTSFIGAEIPALTIPKKIPKDLLRTASFSSQVGLSTLFEAWEDARLGEVDPRRIGLVVGGSNFQQREIALTHETYRSRLNFLRPSYGMTFMDSDICGLCSEIFGIQGFAYTLGGASASGQLAILHAIQALLTNQVDVCIAMGAMMDLSYLECQGFRSIGAMGSDKYCNHPSLASRPFDRDRDGFIYGECCGVIVIEKSNRVQCTGAQQYAKIMGWAVELDGNRNPNPSCEGEVRAIRKALQLANVKPQMIDYVNPHGTGSIIGDEIELEAIQTCGLNHAYINTTKSIIGHGLSAAGTVEVIATLLQMAEKKLHPSRNLDHPIESCFNWVTDKPTLHDINYALNLSMGFGGQNSAICLQNLAFCENGN